MFEKYDTILFFDLETTGLSPKDSSIIEFGGVLRKKDANGKLGKPEEINFLVDSVVEIPQKIVELTNITTSMIKTEGIKEEELYKNLNNFITNNTLFIAYNINFDMHFLTELFRKFNGNDFNFTQDILDVLAVYKDLFYWQDNQYYNLSGINVPNGTNNHKLETAINKFDLSAYTDQQDIIDKWIINIPNSHRAIDDVLATRELLVRLYWLSSENELLDIEKYINFVGYNKKYGKSFDILSVKNNNGYVTQSGSYASIQKEISKRS